MDTLRQFCNEADVRLEIVEPQQFEGQIVSSSRVRQLVRDGEVGLARRILTQPFRIRGMVIHGARPEHPWDFPRRIWKQLIHYCPPMAFMRVTLMSMALNMRRPLTSVPIQLLTKFTRRSKLHVLDFRGTLYGEPLEIDFIERLRDIRTFASVADLTAQACKRCASHTQGMGNEQQKKCMNHHNTLKGE